MFHDMFNDHFESVKDYEYIDQETCASILFHRRLAQVKQAIKRKRACKKRDEIGFNCENNIRHNKDSEGKGLESLMEQCKGKTEIHFGSKVAFGKIYPLDEDQNICRKSNSDLSCKAYLQMEGDLDIIPLKNDSTTYFFTEINLPLFSAGKDSALSAFARWGIRQQIFEGNSEQNRTLGLQWSFRNSNIRLEMSKPKNSLGRLFDISNDDDSLVLLSYELSLQ